MKEREESMCARGPDSRRAPLAFGLALFVAFAASCMDPVHSDAVDALGPEVNGERPGPTHRAGQPCTTCHGALGPGSPEFSFAGTVYATRDGANPAPGVDVVLTGADGRSFTVTTNRVGNFYVTPREWNGPLPVHVKLVSGGETTEMVTRISSDGGCAFCHRSPAGSTNVGHVFLRKE
jgi:hypothetical protein